MSQALINQYLAELDRLKKVGGTHRESVVCEAFTDLLKGSRRRRSAATRSPSHGDTAFTVPLFDEFMKRIMPGEDWRQS